MLPGCYIELIRLPGCFRIYSATWTILLDQKFWGSVVNVLNAHDRIFLSVAGESLIIQASINQLNTLDMQ